MATTTNYGWDTPDDTDLVKDGAAAIRTLGSSVDTTTKALNPSTTLGDVEYRSATANTNTRLPIGTTGQVLTVSGGVPAWTTVAGAAKNWTAVNPGGTALTAANTITISGIDKDNVMVLIGSASAVNSSEAISLRFNSNSGSVYDIAGMQLAAVNSGYDGTTGLTQLILGVSGSSATFLTTAFCIISGAKSTTSGKQFSVQSGTSSGGGTNFAGYNTGGFFDSTTAITSINVKTEGSNFDAGTVYVYQTD